MWNPFKDISEGAITGLGKAVKDAVGAFKADPTKVKELEAAIEMAVNTTKQKIVEAESRAMEAVNATMQAEAKSEHWMQWAWRPTFGFAGSAILINNYILLPYLSVFGIVPMDVDNEVWLMIGAVLGVAAWTRGQVQVVQAKNGNGK